MTCHHIKPYFFGNIYERITKIFKIFYCRKFLNIFIGRYRYLISILTLSSPSLGRQDCRNSTWPVFHAPALRRLPSSSARFVVVRSRTGPVTVTPQAIAPRSCDSCMPGHPLQCASFHSLSQLNNRPPIF